MHSIVMESIEEYLSGALEPGAQRRIETHLSACRSCREEVAGMEDVSLLFGSLRCEEALEPPAGFYARVMARVM